MVRIQRAGKAGGWVSTVQSDVYDWAANVTPVSGLNVKDPNAPYTALLVTIGGTLIVYPYGGPQVGQWVNLGTVNVGQYIRFPIRAVSSSSSATVVGLGSPLYRQGT